MLTLILIGALAVSGLMLLLWLIHLPQRNAAIVDTGWAGGFSSWPARRCSGLRAEINGSSLTISSRMPPPTA